MAFAEKTKLIAKQKSAFRCCICHKPFIEVHHIIPQEVGGSDDLENAATLCASCHDLYGGNPEKKKIIRQMRDHWWELMNQRRFNLTFSPDMGGFLEIEENNEHNGLMRSKGIAIYHVVFENEDFITSAKATHELIKNAQEKFRIRDDYFFLISMDTDMKMVHLIMICLNYSDIIFKHFSCHILVNYICH